MPVFICDIQTYDKEREREREIERERESIG